MNSNDDGLKEEIDINVKERIYNKYNKISEHKNLEIMIVCMVFLFIMLRVLLNSISSIKGYEVYLLIPLALFLLVVGCGASAFFRGRKVEDFDYKNKTLYYYNGEIKEIYRERVKRLCYRYYMEFNADKKIIISYAAYKNIINNNIQNVKVYFYKELLEDERFLDKYIVEEM